MFYMRLKTVHLTDGGKFIDKIEILLSVIAHAQDNHLQLRKYHLCEKFLKEIT